MLNSREQLGEMVKAHRESRHWTQDELASQPTVNANRSVIAHLEQGIRIPKPEMLGAICQLLQIPSRYWRQFLSEHSVQRFAFEEALQELVGFSVTLDGHDQRTQAVAETQIAQMFEKTGSEAQTLDRFNSILVYYGVPPASRDFFKHYLGPEAFSSVAGFESRIEEFQRDAVRLFSTLAEAYREFNKPGALITLLSPLGKRDTSEYTARSEWAGIQEIQDDKLPYLGYVSFTKVKQEAIEREALKNFLTDLAANMDANGRVNLEKIPIKTQKRMDSLLRKFQSQIAHGLFSPLFSPDSDALLREARRIAPTTEQELVKMEMTQDQALENLARYLSADHMDVYIATSMRSDADFVSVNRFARALFSHPKVRPLNLRFFNPTQSWIEDRIAKGLVEALMLKRSSVTIYMAQKTDTFGKDSEASVALGQGKPVVVYVPKLTLPDTALDTESLFLSDRKILIELLTSPEQSEIDEGVDDQSIIARILYSQLDHCSAQELMTLVGTLWADFDLYNESERIEDPSQRPDVTQRLRAEYRSWLDSVVSRKDFSGEFESIRAHVIGILVATAIRFESRAKLFREMHPLALQVILSSGVLNGIIVVRSVEQCAEILLALISNDLKLDLKKEDENYRLIERQTRSTIRVISRHRLLRHAFQSYYGRI